MAKFYSTKTYGNDRGLSCCFRQWRATHSHCSLLHGYSIGIKLIFECDTLDDKNWCMDFGGLDEFKDWANEMFDHTLIIAADDPHLDFFKHMSKLATNDNSTAPLYEQGAICDLRIVDAVGCEMFAKLCYDKMAEFLKKKININSSVRIKSVEVFEHDANSAIYEG